MLKGVGTVAGGDRHMSTSAEHVGFEFEPTVDTRWHRVLISMGVGLLVAVTTLSYVYLAALGRDPAMFGSVAPFIVVASVAGVGLPTYLATDMMHRRTWLQAAWASCLALFMAFLVFWSAALVVTTEPSGVHIGADPVVVSVRFDPAAWRTDLAARLVMARDLCSSGRLRGLTPAQVRAELGEPVEVVGPGCQEMCYAITPTAQRVESSTAAARATLLRVLFSSEGRVASVALGSD